MPASRNEFVDLCVELLRPLGPVRVARMFGGRGLYLDEVFIAILTGDCLYLKTDEQTREAFAAAGGEPFRFERDGKTTTTGYWTVPAEAMESPALMQPWARQAFAAALRAKASKPAAQRRTPRAKPVAAAATPRKPATNAARAKPASKRR